MNREAKPPERPRLWIDLDEDLRDAIEMAAAAEHERPRSFLLRFLQGAFAREVELVRVQRQHNEQRRAALGRR